MKPILSLLVQRPAASAGLAALLFCVGVWVFVGNAPSSPRTRAVISPPTLGDAFADPEISLSPCASMAEYVASVHPSLGAPGGDASKKPKQPLLPGVVLVTGNAGFIGNHLTHRLLKEGYAVIGLDALHADDEVTAAVQLSRLACQGYSSVNKLLPRAYKSEIAPRRSCYVRGSLADAGLLERIVMSFGVTHIVHLAAQAGVRKSLTAPESYLYNNMEGTFSILNAARRLSAVNDAAATTGRLSASEATALAARAAAHLRLPLPPWAGRGTVEHVAYASSSSVYGETDGSAAAEGAGCADRPLSMYAASKRSTELLASSYASMFHLPSTGLRFFTVYGTHGRPDMAVWKFTDAVQGGRPIALTATSAFKRDFTHVSDIVEGIVCIMLHPPPLGTAAAGVDPRPHTVFNIGRADPVTVDELISIIEVAAGKKAIVQRQDALSVDVTSTHADVSKLMGLCGKSPATPLKEGVTAFVRWYQEYSAGKSACAAGWPREN